jgi:hypothetical protein
VIDRPCPECGHALAWETAYPPIPLTVYTWFDREGEAIQFCPGCDTELPEGDLTINATDPAGASLPREADGVRQGAS